MKKTILYTFLFLFAFSAKAQIFHAIILANTLDESIGPSVTKNYYKMEIEFANIAAANNMKLKTYYYRDLDYNKETLMQVLNSELSCNSKDIVFFTTLGTAEELRTIKQNGRNWLWAITTKRLFR